MTETLLSTSNVLIFGRVVEDLRPAPGIEVEVAISEPVNPRQGLGTYDGVTLAVGNFILLQNQSNQAHNGIFRVTGDGQNTWEKQPLQPIERGLVKVKNGESSKGLWKKKGTNFGRPHQRGSNLGKNRFMETQLEDALFARIYGFSYEGHYYELSRPTLFLVHGEGMPAVLPTGGVAGNASLARAPQEPSLSGVGVADFQLADGLMVWSYDQADYTIRMDVENGMFEQVLLDAFFDGGGGGGRVSGAMVSGAMVGGPSTRGAMVRGAMVSGAMLRGRRGGRGDPSD